jgi:hemerythrin-like metal-binding protein
MDIGDATKVMSSIGGTMAMLEWKEELSVGIKSIDDQHKILIGLVNTLSDGIAAGKGKDILEKLFDDIVKYTVTHFAYEKNFFETHKYPDTAAHLAEHDALVKQALELQGKFKAGNTSISLSTQKFLMDWLKNHIMGTDKKYTKYLVEKGVK